MIENRVASSGLITLDPEDFLTEKPILSFDLSRFLWQGIALREKEYREALKNEIFEDFRGKTAALYCSVDAIIPAWAWMLAASHISEWADGVYYGTPEEAAEAIVLSAIANLDNSKYKGVRVVLKGCGKRNFSPAVQVAITNKLRPVVGSLMFGEPCATVPVYKAPKS
jgi:hypothetical protein